MGGASIERGEPGLAYVERLESGAYVVGNPSTSAATIKVKLGADVPYFLEMKGLAYAAGIGEELEDLGLTELRATNAARAGVDLPACHDRRLVCLGVRPQADARGRGRFLHAMNVADGDGTIDGTSNTGIRVGEPGVNDSGPNVTVTSVSINGQTFAVDHRRVALIAEPEETHAIFRDAAAQGSFTHVYVERATNKPVPLPDVLTCTLPPAASAFVMVVTLTTEGEALARVEMEAFAARKPQQLLDRARCDAFEARDRFIDAILDPFAGVAAHLERRDGVRRGRIDLGADALDPFSRPVPPRVPGLAAIRPEHPLVPGTFRGEALEVRPELVRDLEARKYGLMGRVIAQLNATVRWIRRQPTPESVTLAITNASGETA